MAKQELFDQAEVIHAESEELSKREMEACQAIVNRDYHNEKEKLNEKQQAEMESLLKTREHFREVLLARQKQEKDNFYRREAVVELMEKEPLRTREAQLNVRMNSRNSKPNSRLMNSAEISFKRTTVLPPLVPPVSGRQSQSRSVSGDRPLSKTSSIRSISSRYSNRSHSSLNSRGTPHSRLSNYSYKSGNSKNSSNNR